MASPTQRLDEQYKGWSVLSLSNPWVHVQIAPDLGGRIIQIRLAGHPFLFGNPALEGVKPGPDGLSEDGTWLNFGGEKIWPAPQGWGVPGHWPGPPDPVLDSGAYIMERDDQHLIRLTSPVDVLTGLQISRTVALSEKKAEIRVRASFTNKGTEPREWSIWPVIQMNAEDMDYPGRYRVICPVNPFSRFENGYSVMHGLVNSPQFGRNSSGHFEIQFQYLIGKVGLDCIAGWMAYCDRKTGKVMVARFDGDPEANYPDHTSVQVWTQGRGMIYSRNRITEFADDAAGNPPYLEMELLGPLEYLRPGATSHFNYSLLTCTLPPESTITHATENVVMAENSFEIQQDGSVRIAARLGAFLTGYVKLEARDTMQNTVSYMERSEWIVDPINGLEIDAVINKDDLKNAATVSLTLYDTAGNFIEAILERQIK